MTCFECGAPADHEHHVVPRSLGGTRTVPLCALCHGKAHGRERGFRNTPELTKAALARLKANGVQLGAAALGWRHTGEVDAAGRRLVEPVASEAATVARILELRAEGRSLRAIGEVLNAEGHRTKAGGRWHAMTIQRVLERRES